jgi:hypothetical protein
MTAATLNEYNRVKILLYYISVSLGYESKPFIHRPISHSFFEYVSLAAETSHCRRIEIKINHTALDLISSQFECFLMSSRFTVQS